MVIISQSAQETKQFAARVAEQFKSSGGILALSAVSTTRRAAASARRVAAVVAEETVLSRPTAGAMDALSGSNGLTN